MSNLPVPPSGQVPDGSREPDHDGLITRVDEVIARNTRIEYLYIGCTVSLFLVGIGCVVSAVISREYLWASPSVLTTYLLRWPLDQILKIRSKNIALATAPAIIRMLPSEKAAEELQKLIQRLYGDDTNAR